MARWDNEVVSTSTLIIGAGFSGLATAHFLMRRLGPEAHVTVLDSSPRVGGKINTVRLAGLPVDTGPDAFLSRAAELRELIDELGLNSDVIEPQPGGAYIWSRGKLRPIPDGASFGLPGRLGPLLRSRLLSPAGVARAGMDIVLPTSHRSQDPSVADLVRPRFGSEVYDRLVEPLLGGVHAGDPARLSAKSTVPEIKAMAEAHRSLYLTMRSRRAQAPQTSGCAVGFHRRGHGGSGGRSCQGDQPSGSAGRNRGLWCRADRCRLVHLDRRRSDFSRGTGSGGARLRRRGSARTTCA